MLHAERKPTSVKLNHLVQRAWYGRQKKRSATLIPLWGLRTSTSRCSVQFGFHFFSFDRVSITCSTWATLDEHLNDHGNSIPLVSRYRLSTCKSGAEVQPGNPSQTCTNVKVEDGQFVLSSQSHRSDRLEGVVRISQGMEVSHPKNFPQIEKCTSFPCNTWRQSAAVCSSCKRG
jgi:hypothetical protein